MNSHNATSLSEKKGNLSKQNGKITENWMPKSKAIKTRGNSFLKAARDKTNGLATVEEIDTAIEGLDTTIKAKADRREEANQKLQESRDQRTEKQANHRSCQNRQGECSENFETASAAYFDKLSSVGFDSPEVHDKARSEQTRRLNGYKKRSMTLPKKSIPLGKELLSCGTNLRRSRSIRRY